MKVTSISLDELVASLPAGTPQPAINDIIKAYQFVQETHAEHQPDLTQHLTKHSVAVAHIISQLELDSPTIIAALLHNLLPYNLDTSDIEIAFGGKTAHLITGLKKLATYTQEYSDETDTTRWEEIRGAMLTIIEGDIRVVLVQLANILQQLRKAGEQPVAERQAVAQKVMYIYAPLANRLGIWQLKWELEDLAFRYSQPEQYKKIASRLDEKRVVREERIQTAITTLREAVSEVGIEATIIGRPKHIYSIYRKMERKKVDFSEIYDAQALRVIISTEELEASNKKRKQKDQLAKGLCYQVLGFVHSLWQPIPQEFDDYVGSPKPNGYQSLHTAVRDEAGNTLEVQIRTDRMDKEAERGVAAHWAYKEGEGQARTALNRRIQQFREMLATVQQATESQVLDTEALHNEVFGERVYVFTPRGDVLELPAGSTPIDFAYKIHTEVGHRCRGAKIDNKMVSLDYQLKSGERVEIITAGRGGPSRDWMSESLGYTGSARTRGKIRQWFRQQERDKNIVQGRDIVLRELKRLGLQDEISLDELALAMHETDVDQFLLKVGFGDIQLAQLGGAIAVIQKESRPDDELVQLLSPSEKTHKGMTVKGMSGLHTKLAKCCTPIPPEPILGYITRGRGVTVHNANCATLNSISERERIIEVDWGIEKQTHPIPMVIRAYHRSGLVEEIAKILQGRNITVPKTKRTTANTISTIYLIAEVHNLEELHWLFQRVEKVKNVFEVRRQRWK